MLLTDKLSFITLLSYYVLVFACRTWVVTYKLLRWLGYHASIYDPLRNTSASHFDNDKKQDFVTLLSRDAHVIVELILHLQDLVQYFSGNKKLAGSETAAHCYCGHQFGAFSGQLGDGATMYLGEVVNLRKQRWELQLKGAGPTPFSR